MELSNKFEDLKLVIRYGDFLKPIEIGGKSDTDTDRFGADTFGYVSPTDIKIIISKIKELQTILNYYAPPVKQEGIKTTFEIAYNSHKEITERLKTNIIKEDYSELLKNTQDINNEIMGTLEHIMRTYRTVILPKMRDIMALAYMFVPGLLTQEADFLKKYEKLYQDCVMSYIFYNMLFQGTTIISNNIKFLQDNMDEIIKRTAASVRASSDLDSRLSALKANPPKTVEEDLADRLAKLRDFGPNAGGSTRPKSSKPSKKKA